VDTCGSFDRPSKADSPVVTDHHTRKKIAKERLHIHSYTEKFNNINATASVTKA
jgi:hypothetical protein